MQIRCKKMYLSLCFILKCASIVKGCNEKGNWPSPVKTIFNFLTVLAHSEAKILLMCPKT